MLTGEEGRRWGELIRDVRDEKKGAEEAFLRALIDSANRGVYNYPVPDLTILVASVVLHRRAQGKSCPPGGFNYQLAAIAQGIVNRYREGKRECKCAKKFCIDHLGLKLLALDEQIS